MASSVAPKRTLTYYSRLALWLAILIIAAGLFAQSLQINLLTQSNVDASYSQAITEQIDRAFKLRLQDTKDLQQAVSHHPYTLNALQEGDDEWLQDISSFLQIGRASCRESGCISAAAEPPRGEATAKRHHRRT